MKKNSLLSLMIFVSGITIGQPIVPAGPTKIRQTDRTGVLYINTRTSDADGNVQMVNQNTTNPAAVWKFILISPGTYQIQNTGTGQFLGVNTNALVPQASASNKPQGYLNKYFLYASGNGNSDLFKWKVVFYRQIKPGTKSGVLDASGQKSTAPYDVAYRTNDEYDIINVATKSRLQTINVNGLANGDNVSRAMADRDDEDEYGTVITKDGTGSLIYTKTDKYVARNNQTRWQLIGLPLPKNNEGVIPTNEAVTKPQQQTGNGAVNQQQGNNQQNNHQHNNNPNSNSIEQTNLQNKTLDNQIFILKRADLFSVKDGKRKKLPSLLNALLKNKIEIQFINSSQAVIKNSSNGQVSNYNWQLKNNNTLLLIPQNKADDSYTGEVRFEGIKMIYVVKEGNTETEYVYEKK